MFFVFGIGGGPVSVPPVKSLRTPKHVAGGHGDRQGMALTVPASMVTGSRGARPATRSMSASCGAGLHGLRC